MTLCGWMRCQEQTRGGQGNYQEREETRHAPGSEGKGGAPDRTCPPEPITLSVPPRVPGPDIWDRSTCPWESFSEEGLSSPDDTHGNTCHTWATGHFFCKRCKNPHGYHPRKWRGKVRERTKKVKCECWHAHSGHVCFRKTSCAPSNTLKKYSRKVGNTSGTVLTCSTQLTLGRGSVLKLEFTEKPCHHLGPNSLYST